MKDLDPGVESSKVEQLTTENQTLRSRVQMLEGATSPEGMEGESTRESLVQEKEELLVEVDRLRRLSQSASKVSQPVPPYINYSAVENELKVLSNPSPVLSLSLNAFP